MQRDNRCLASGQNRIGAPLKPIPHRVVGIFLFLKFPGRPRLQEQPFPQDIYQKQSVATV